LEEASSLCLAMLAKSLGGEHVGYRWQTIFGLVRRDMVDM
jgi:hypothetical protein